MINYAGLPAADAIKLWQQTHQQLAQKYGLDLKNTDPKVLAAGLQQMTPEDRVAFTPYDIQTQNPDAFQVFKQGVDTGDGKTRRILDPATGEWTSQEKHGLFSHWETWVQIGAGAALGGVVAAPYIAAAMAGSAAPATSAAALEAGATAGIPGAVTTAGLVAPDALTLGGAAAAAAAPAAAPALATPAAFTPAAPAAAPEAAAPLVNAGLPGSSGYAPGISGGFNDGVDWAGLAANRGVQTGVGVFGSLLGTYMTNRAASNAAQTTADANKYAADLSDAANKRAEQFLREQAENQFLNTEATRKGNYDQWAEQAGRFSTLGSSLGLAPRNLPAYVPGVDPRYTTSATDSSSSSSTSGTPSASGPWDPAKFAQIVGRAPSAAETAFYKNVPTWETDVRNAAGGGAPTTPGSYGTGYKGSQTAAQPYTGQFGNDDISQAVASNYASLGTNPTGSGTGPTDLAYFAKRIAETGGLTDANKAYWFGPNGRIAQELKGAVPPEPTSNAPLPRAKLPTGLGTLATNPTFWWS